jgi:hypothetical protein
MISKGNELLQELYKRLKDLWENGKPFPMEERKEIIMNISKEYLE